MGHVAELFIAAAAAAAAPAAAAWTAIARGWQMACLMPERV
jgi:invasion protein IalB